MTPTWKVGETWFKFVDSMDRMGVLPVTVHKVHKLKTEVRGRRGTREVIENRLFLTKFAQTERSAVNLAIQDMQRQARFHEGVAASRRMLAGNYQTFLLEMEG